MLLMVKGNRETHVDELLVDEMKEKGYVIVEQKKEVKKLEKEKK